MTTIRKADRSTAVERTETSAQAAPETKRSGVRVVVDDKFLPIKAAIVDREGRTLGTRQIRSRELIGQVAGHQSIVEHGAGVATEHMYYARVSHLAPVEKAEWAGSEVRTLASQGPSANRIDLTILAEGYTEAEKEKFFKDAQQTCDELFGADTFKSYLALFNVHAVFLPSRESGIGDGRSKDTALGCYRDARMRQAVMPGNASAARKAAKLAPDTDYPIILANDKTYGGLGGEFAITTASPFNLTTVLRHELGHNFGRVGEEYDGGQVYDGANHSSSTNVPWKHFVKGETTPVHKAPLLHYSAPWKNLSKGVWETTFNVPAEADRVKLDFSSLGFDTHDDVELLVDGKPVAFDGKFNYDRNFYLVTLPLTPGKHTITFREKKSDGNNVISKVGIYALPKDFPSDRALVGAWGTYREGGSASGYRPTESDCLMRDMQLRHFCPPCQENMWRNFLKEVSLIDGIEVANGQISAKTVPVGDEHLKIEWLDPKGKARPDLEGQRTWTPAKTDTGKWTLKVTFVSDEVKDPGQKAWTEHKAQFDIKAVA